MTDLSLNAVSFFRIILISLVITSSTGCSDDEPAVFGNDGATLNNFNLEGTLALLSNHQGSSIEDSKGALFTNMKLYTLSKGGVLAELPVHFSGSPNGGTNHYILYSLNDQYSILSFFTRKESYIINQANGEVHKTIYLAQPINCVAGASDLYFGDLYSLNTSGVYRNLKISNFLSAFAEETEMPTDDMEFILDKGDSLYSLSYDSPFDVFYHNDGKKTKITSAIAAFNDHQNKLNVVSTDGDISSIKFGLIYPQTSMQDVSLSGSLFYTYPFPEEQKTFAVLRNNISHSVMLYDVTRGDKILNISTLHKNNFTFIKGAAYGKYLFLLGIVSNGTMLVRIDVTDYSTTEVLFDKNSLFYTDHLTALSDTELVIQNCEPLPNIPGACQTHLVYFDIDGNVKKIFNEFNPEGQVIKISDNQ